MTPRHRRFATAAVHAGDPHPRVDGSVVPPIWQTSTFENAGGDPEAVRYTRLSNTPGHEILHARLAELENAEAALVTASGMAAISAAMLTFLSSGDHVIVHRTLYGGTHELVYHSLREWGISVTAVDTSDRTALDAARRPGTKVVYTESIVNPTLEVPDHDVVVSFAREHGIVSIIDGTFTSPYLFRPIDIGYDVVIHSATKYLNGHSDVIAGSCAGTRERITAINRTLSMLGGSLDPLAGFLLARGTRTLHLRMQRQCENAMALAETLARMKSVSRVYYPWLESHPTHGRAVRYFSGGGGVVSFEVAGGADEADRVISRLRIPAHAPSLGGVESLVCRPVQTSHSLLTSEEQRTSGISENLIRVAVGVEAAEDLIEDFRSALEGDR